MKKTPAPIRPTRPLPNRHRPPFWFRLRQVGKPLVLRQMGETPFGLHVIEGTRGGSIMVRIASANGVGNSSGILPRCGS